jgi:hypothetical protein
MKIVSVHAARVFYLKAFKEILPLESVYAPDLCAALAERYSFVYPPDFSQPLSTTQEKGLEFAIGRFEMEAGSRVIDRLLVTQEGLAVLAPTTEIGEAFLVDLLGWGVEAHGFRVPENAHASFAFLSQLVVEFDASIDHAVRALATLSAACGDSFTRTYGAEVGIHCYGFSLNYDRTAVTGRFSSLSSFGIERRVGEAYTTNRLFCQAPLRTADHIKLLELFETTLA